MQKMKKGSVIMKELSKRTKTFTDSVIRRMTRIANEYGAIGSLTLTHSQNSQMSFMYGFFFVKFLFFTVVCVVIVI